MLSNSSYTCIRCFISIFTCVILAQRFDLNIIKLINDLKAGFTRARSMLFYVSLHYIYTDCTQLLCHCILIYILQHSVTVDSLLNIFAFSKTRLLSSIWLELLLAGSYARSIICE